VRTPDGRPSSAFLFTGEPHTVKGIENVAPLVVNLQPKHLVEDAAMPLSPLEAAHRVNEQITVQMLVKAAKNCQHCSQIFLDSEEDHHDPNNMAVAVTKTGKPRFNDMGIHDPAGHFKGKLIRVTGVVTLKQNQPQIAVDDPRQIEVVEKDK
jgi:DNA/RNA endonuclease YhcR with UshA esterase domain